MRIYPLYLTIYFVNITFFHYETLSGDVVAYAKSLLAHLFMVQEYVKLTNIVGGSWTLSLEMVWYIGISAMFLVALNKKTNLLVLLTAMVSIIASAVCAYDFHLPMGRLSMLVCCVLGLVCYRYNKGDISRKQFGVLCCSLLLLIAMNLSSGFWLFPSENSTASFTMVHNSWFVAALLFFVPFIFRKSSIWDHSVLAYLGRISYSIYLVHGVLLHMLKETSLRGWGLIAVTFALTFVVATLTYYYIESPAIRLGRKWKQKEKKLAVA